MRNFRCERHRKEKEKKRNGKHTFSWQAQGFGDLGSSRFGGSLARSAWSNHALIVAFTDNEQRFMRFAVSRRRVLRVFCIGWLRALEWKFQSGCFMRFLAEFESHFSAAAAFAAEQMESQQPADGDKNSKGKFFPA